MRVGRAVLVLAATVVFGGCASATQPLESQSAPPQTTLVPPPTAVVPSPTTVVASLKSGLPACKFKVTVTTDRTTYTVGQPVKIMVTGTNPGPPCLGSPGGLTDGLAGAGAAYDSANHKVWDDWAQPNQIGPAVSGGAAAIEERVPHNFKDALPETWDQDRCTLDSSAREAVAPNPDCPQTQVPPGKYTIVVDQHAATITITG